MCGEFLYLAYLNKNGKFPKAKETKASTKSSGAGLFS